MTNDYIAMSHQFLSLSIPEYVSSTLKYIKFEEEQAEFYYPKSLNVIKSLLEKELITKRALTLIDVP